MSAFNPFRARKVDGGSTQDGSTASQPPINLPPDLFTKPIQPLSSQLPNGHPRKPALSLEIEDQDSSSSSSDEQTADPFNPDSSVSDNEDDEHHNERLRSFASPTDHSRDTVGSAPHPAPSEDGSTATSPVKSLSAQVSTTEVEGTNISQSTTPVVAPSAGYKSPESEGNTNSSSRADRDKKPPPPPRSHHGKRINASGSRSTSRPESSRSTNRLSFHASSPESVTSVQPPGASNDNAAASSPSPTPPPAPRPTSDYFLTASDSQQTTGSTDSLQRSHSQSRRPPTPPLSRRHSQMRRSKSTQSKSSNSRLTMSSLDSESNDSSQPPSPGPSTRSVASSMSQDRKRVSMPPPASGEIRAATAVSAAALPATGAPADSLSPPPSSRPTPSQPNRRASSYGSPGTGGPPPPPPPRRARDSNTRNSDGGADAQANRTEAPLPQPSNANDILADLSRLQKEVDDLRGHYEGRKVNQ